MKNNKVIKALYIVLGVISFGFGCLGIILPILPTVPFFLLTSFCFAKGSERFHRWFLETKVYNKYVSGFAEHRSMSIGGELFLLIFVTCVLATTCLLLKDSLIVMICAISVEIAKYSYFIFKVKTVSRTELSSLKLKKKNEVINMESSL